MKYFLATTILARLATAISSPAGAELRERGRDETLSQSTFSQDSTEASSASNKFSKNWAGVSKAGKGFHHVEGTFTVPEVTGGRDAAAAAWIGIDGEGCEALIQTGLAFYGDGSYTAWFEWTPEPSQRINNFPVRVGDRIKITVDVSGPRDGVTVLENLRTGNKARHQITNPRSSLCRASADWIVEDFSKQGHEVPFANFHEINFTDASAEGSGGRVTPRGGTLVEILGKDHQTLAKCSIEGDDVACKYTGGGNK